MAMRNTRRRQRGAAILLSFGEKEASSNVNSTQKKSFFNRIKNWGKSLFVKESPLSTSTKPATSIGKPLIPLKEVVVSPGPSPAQSSTAPVVAVSPGVSPNPPTALTMNTPPGSANSGIQVSVPFSGLPQTAIQPTTPSPAPGMPPQIAALGGRRKNKRKQSKCKHKQTRRKSNRKQSRRNRK